MIDVLSYNTTLQSLFQCLPYIFDNIRIFLLSLLLLLSKYKLQKVSENCSPELDLQIALLT